MDAASAQRAPTDQELLERHLGGAALALADLIDRHQRMVYATCLRITGNHHDAEEAAQVTFLILARKAGRLRRVACLAAWLHQASRFIALRSRRARMRRARRERALGSLAQEPAARAATGADADDEAGDDRLDGALARLPERYREPLLLHCQAGLSCSEIAPRIGSSVGNVATLLSRGRDMLRRRLGERSEALLGTAMAGSSAPTALAFPHLVLAPGAPSAPIAALLRASLSALRLSAWTTISACCGAAALLVCATGLLMRFALGLGAAQPAPARADSAVAPRAAVARLDGGASDSASVASVAVVPYAAAPAMSNPFEPVWMAELFRSLARPVTLHATRVDALSLLQELARSSGVPMAMPALLSAAPSVLVSIAAAPRPLQDVLDEIGRDAHWSYGVDAGGLLWHDAGPRLMQPQTMPGVRIMAPVDRRWYPRCLLAPLLPAQPDGADEMAMDIRRTIVPETSDAQASTSFEVAGGSYAVFERPAVQQAIERYLEHRWLRLPAEARAAAIAAAQPPSAPPAPAAVPAAELAMRAALATEVPLPTPGQTVRGYLTQVARLAGLRLQYADDAQGADGLLPAQRLRFPGIAIAARHALCLALIGSELRVSMHLADRISPDGVALLVSRADLRQRLRRAYAVGGPLRSFYGAQSTPEDIEVYLSANLGLSDDWLLDDQGRIAITSCLEIHAEIDDTLRMMVDAESPHRPAPALVPLALDQARISTVLDVRPGGSRQF